MNIDIEMNDTYSDSDDTKKDFSSDSINNIYIRRYNDPIIKLTADDMNKDNEKINFKEVITYNNIDDYSIEIILLNGDHTIANLIQKSLVNDNRIDFVGYRMIHPLENRIVIKLKLKEQKNVLDNKSFLKPKELLNEHLLSLKNTIKNLKNEFINSL